MPYTKRIYQVLHPNDSLIASQLEAHEFALHYQTRAASIDGGKLIFAEIDPIFRNENLRIEHGLKGLVPHDDGSPKRTKFISCYRTLENIDLDAILTLYLANPDGSIMKLDRSEYKDRLSEGKLKILAEICPLSMLVLTNLSSRQFGDIITNPEYGKGASKLLFTELDFDIARFLEEFENRPLMPAPIPNVHPSKLRDAILELQRNKGKTMKGLCLAGSLDVISYKMIRCGFWFVSAEKRAFFQMPGLEEIKTQWYRFWRSL